MRKAKKKVFFEANRTRHREFGKLVRDARKAAGLTLEAVAKRIGTSGPFVSMMESGRRRPTVSVFKKLQRVLKVTIPFPNPASE